MKLKVVETGLPGVLVVEPQLHADARGFFVESFNQRDFNAATGTNFSFVQDNHSRSARGVLRGLHYQLGQPQGKLVRVLRGSAFDVVVDIRQSSPTFGKWFGLELNERDSRQIWLPPGLAHGFLVLSDTADLFYKTTDYYAPEMERCIAWNDPALDIDWPLTGQPLLSAKDTMGMLLETARSSGLLDR